jgi:hypothetical protein
MRCGGPRCQGGSQRIGGLEHARDRGDASRNEPSFSQKIVRWLFGIQRWGRTRSWSGLVDAQQNSTLLAFVACLMVPPGRDLLESLAGFGQCGSGPRRRLIAADDDVDVARIGYDAAAHPRGVLGGDQG